MVYEKTPLKGILSQGSKEPARGVTFRIARAGKQQKGRRLLILRGFARAEGGSLKSFAVRAMLDSGAEGNFIAPSLARKIGARITTGNFGVAVEAFGGETKIEGEIPEMHVTFRGAQPHSGLSQEFTARISTLIAPRELDHAYELLLGEPFLEQFGAQLRYGAQGCIQLTAADGTTTSFARDGGSDGAAADGDGAQTAGVATAGVAAAGVAAAAPQKKREYWIKPETGAQRRERQRERARFAEEDAKQAERAARERPDLVMTAEELEELMRTAAAGTVVVTPILPCGWKKARAGVKTARIRITQITARGAAAAKETERAAAAAGSTTEKEEDRQGQLPPEEHARAEAMRARLEKDFPTVFTKELPPLSELPQADGPGVEIRLKESAQPTGRYGPRMTQEDTEEAGRMLEELLAKGFIRPSRSPWGAPMFLVAKPDGGKRMVIDYRALNASTVRNRYPLPRVDELFDQLRGARYFSKIDLRTGYWQIRMAADAVEKTAFTSRHGHYEWLVLPMGLTNAPAEFMALMETTFQAELNKFVLVFLDDILIYSKTLEEHEAHLRAALERLRARKLHAKISKCQFFRQEVEFLGHYVGRAGVRMVEGKVDAVRAWPTPTKQKDVEQFIGLAGYYRRFIANFSTIAAPLTQLCGTLKKATGGRAERAPPKKTFTWGAEQQAAFEQLKEAVSSAPCLAMPDPAREFIVHTDASGHATGAVLMQQFDEGLRPIAFLSKKMKPAERNYPVYEQELLAILNALRAWRHYLGGRHFTVWTDHQSLQYVEVSAMATPRQVRWATWLSEFDFSIKYAPGSKNVVADGLSRAAAGGAPDAGSDARAGQRLLLQAVTEIAPMPVRIRRAAMQDAAYQQMVARTDGDLEARGMAKHDGLLYRVDVEHGERLVVPENAALRTWMLSWAHDALEGGHRGGARLAKWLQARVWWPGIADDAQRYASSCETCQRGKADQRGKQGMPLSLATPKRAGEVICMDFIGPLPRAVNGETHVMVVIDKLTRFVMYIPLHPKATAQQVFGALDSRWLAMLGVPRAIVSDRDSRFTSRFWEDLWEGLRTELKRSTSFHAQTDGATENANKHLIVALRAFVEGQKEDWAPLLPQLQRATNASVCASTGFSPDYMMFGREMRAGMDADLEAAGVVARDRYPGAQQIHERRAKAEDAARKQIEKAQAKQRADSARGRRPAEIAAGDKVWLANRNMRAQDTTVGARKLEALYYGPYTVLEMHGPNAARLELPAGCRLHPVFNLDLLKKYIDGAREFPDRPARYGRPGPVLEEDPAAGGPVSGDPVYEVEAVIARRGRGARKEYRVLWKGWPPETASWLGSDNWAGCEEAIAEFEQRPVGVSALHAGRRARQVDTAETRREAIKTTMENQPRAADRPPVDGKGQIDMGSQRCTADTKARCWCKARTKHGCLCWVHRAARDGTRIKDSAVAGAGRGLFAARDFAKNEVVARYTGDLINTAEGRADGEGFGGSHYVLELSEQLAIDAARTNTADGRLINDARGSNRRANVRFVANQRAKTVTIRTTRRVREGEEFLLSYGRSFWGAAPRADAEVGERAVGAGPRAQGDSKDHPIVLATMARRIHVNMMGRRAQAGQWINARRWRCACAREDDARSADLEECPTCWTARPARPDEGAAPPAPAAAAAQTAGAARAPQVASRASAARAAADAWEEELDARRGAAAEDRHRDEDGEAAGQSSARVQRSAEEIYRIMAGDAAADEATREARADPSRWSRFREDEHAAGAAAPAADAARGQAQPEEPQFVTASSLVVASRRVTLQQLTDEARAEQESRLNKLQAAAAGGDAAAGDKERRRAQWEGAERVHHKEEQQRRVNRGRHGDKPPTHWAHTVCDTDCRGVASKSVPAQARFKVERVREFRAGYCARNTCECCAPPEVAGGHWCSCLAVQDGLCRRCWYDYYVGKDHLRGAYWGPKNPRG